MTYFLRELSEADLPEITKWRNSRDVIKFLGAPFRYIDRAVDVKWYQSYLSNRNNNIRLAICNSETNSIIGAVYILGIDWINRSGEFSIWIGNKECHGKGAGKFATSALLAHAFFDLNLHRVHLTVLANNERAINLYKKMGFFEEGRLRDAVFKNGDYIDLIQMSILSHEFNKELNKIDTSSISSLAVRSNVMVCKG